MRNPLVIQLAALTVAMTIAALATVGIPSIAVTLLVLSATFAIATVGLIAIPAIKKASRDPYDLSRLREVDDQADHEDFPDVPGVHDPGYVICRNCGDPFHPELHFCPRCKSCC